MLIGATSLLKFLKLDSTPLPLCSFYKILILPPLLLLFFSPLLLLITISCFNIISVISWLFYLLSPISNPYLLLVCLLHKLHWHPGSLPKVSVWSNFMCGLKSCCSLFYSRSFQLILQTDASVLASGPVVFKKKKITKKILSRLLKYRF